MYRWRISQVGHRHGERADLTTEHTEYTEKENIILTTNNAYTTKKIIIIKYLYRHLRLSGRVPLAYSQVGRRHGEMAVRSWKVAGDFHVRHLRPTCGIRQRYTDVGYDQVEEKKRRSRRVPASDLWEYIYFWFNCLR